MVHCIITGFDPFGGAQTNPSQLAVERLNNAVTGSNGDAFAITKTVLTTCCNQAWKQVQEIRMQVPPNEHFFVLLAGVAEPRDVICLERFALNVRQYRLKDNCGHQWQDERIDETGPDAVRTTVLLPKMADELRDKGHFVEVSNYAGAFVCNETYYRAMRTWHDDPQCVGVLFVHFPGLDRYKVVAELQQDEDIIEAFRLFLEDVVRYVNIE